MKKKWIRWVAAGVAVILFGLAGGEVALRWASSSDWAREWARQKAAEMLHREVRLQKMSASFSGIKLDGLEIAEPGGFDEGTFVSAQRVRVRVNLLALLCKRLSVRAFIITQAKVNLVRREDGTFNFDGIVPASEDKPKDEKPSAWPLDITLDRLSMRDMDLTYTDLQQHTRAAASDVAFQISQFGLKQKFSVEIKSVLTYETQGKTISVPAGLQAQAYLEGFNLARAYVEVGRFTAQYKDASFTLRLRVEDFTRPLVHAALQLENVTSAVVAEWMDDVPEFTLPELSAVADARIDLKAQKADIQQLSLELPGLESQFAGEWDYARQQPNDFETSFTVDLADIAKLVPLWVEEYRLKGELTGSASQKEGALTADVVLKNGAGRVPYTGEFTKVAASFHAQEKAGLTEGSASGSLSGRLNGDPFNGSLALTQLPDEWKADVKLRAGRVALPPLAQTPPADETLFVADTKLPVAEKAAWPLPPVSVKADIVIDSLDAPYIYGTDLNFQANLTGVTPDLKTTHGELRLDMGSGEIKDLYRLTNANAVTKILFLSVNVVGKVFNTMNVFAVLDGLGSGLLNVIGMGAAPKEADLVVQTVTDPDGTTHQIMVPYTDRKISGRMAYDKFSTDVDFKQGLANIENGIFVSDTVSFALDGTTDFNSGNLDMTVQAAPGKHEADGIMPLTLKIGGTVSDPKGSMSVISSVSSLVTQGLGNNFASRSVKKGLGGLFGLFKKDKSDKKEKQTDTMPAAAEPAVSAAPVQGAAPQADKSAQTGTTAPADADKSAAPIVSEPAADEAPAAVTAPTASEAADAGKPAAEETTPNEEPPAEE